MLQGEVFIFEFIAIDGFAAGAVVVGEVTSLTHEIWNDTMENGSFVSETFFASAQSTEVFTCLWYYVRTELLKRIKKTNGIINLYCEYGIRFVYRGRIFIAAKNGLNGFKPFILMNAC